MTIIATQDGTDVIIKETKTLTPEECKNRVNDLLIKKEHLEKQILEINSELAEFEKFVTIEKKGEEIVPSIDERYNE